MNLDEIAVLLGKQVEEHPFNTVNKEGIKINKIFDRPLVKVADAADPLFSEFKNPEVIGRHHLLPAEWLQGARTVVSYFLPFSLQVRKANRSAGWPAREWVYARIEGEEFNNHLRGFLINQLKDAGGRAMAPMLEKEFRIASNLRSNWSERHAAYVTGLGTFSLSRNMITPKGCAGRYGSVITDLDLGKSIREYTQIEEYCTMCGKCVDRCPSGAITMEGKDLQVCNSYIENNIKPRFKPRYGCGKCQVDVDCESSIP